MKVVVAQNEHTDFNSLPDDALLTIGKWIAATGAQTLARFLKVNRRLRSVLGQPIVLKTIIQETMREATLHTANITPGTIETLEQFALWESAYEIGLWEENRMGFGYGSTQIAQDQPRDSRQPGQEDILNSQTRLLQVAEILRRFPESVLRIEAHCGTAAPRGIAESFSFMRGQAVVTHVLRLLTVGYDPDIQEARVGAGRRLDMRHWGMRIAEAAEASQHHHRFVAQQGKGWVELYLRLGDNLELPPRPKYYQGPIREADEETDAAVRVVFMHMGNQSEDESSQDEDADSFLGNMSDIEEVD